MYTRLKRASAPPCSYNTRPVLHPYVVRAIAHGGWCVVALMRDIDRWLPLDHSLFTQRQRFNASPTNASLRASYASIVYIYIYIYIYAGREAILQGGMLYIKRRAIQRCRWWRHARSSPLVLLYYGLVAISEYQSVRRKPINPIGVRIAAVGRLTWRRIVQHPQPATRHGKYTEKGFSVIAFSARYTYTCILVPSSTRQSVSSKSVGRRTASLESSCTSLYTRLITFRRQRILCKAMDAIAAAAERRMQRASVTATVHDSHQHGRRRLGEAILGERARHVMQTDTFIGPSIDALSKKSPPIISQANNFGTIIARHIRHKNDRLLL